MSFIESNLVELSKECSTLYLGGELELNSGVLGIESAKNELFSFFWNKPSELGESILMGLRPKSPESKKEFCLSCS